MAYSAEHYLELLQALLPTGLIWTREPDADLTNLLMALADEFARVDHRGDDLVEESAPRTAVEILDEWEAILDLPDTCTQPPESIQERQFTAWIKMTTLGDGAPGYIIDFLEQFDISPVQIIERKPTLAGMAVAGDLCYSNDDIFQFEVLAPDVEKIKWAQAGIAEAGDKILEVTGYAVWAKAGLSEAGDKILTVVGREKLECIVNRWKPAHTEAVFNYYLGVGYDEGYDLGYDIDTPDPTAYGSYDFGYDAGYYSPVEPGYDEGFNEGYA